MSNSKNQLPTTAKYIFSWHMTYMEPMPCISAFLNCQVDVHEDSPETRATPPSIQDVASDRIVFLISARRKAGMQNLAPWTLSYDIRRCSEPLQAQSSLK